MTCAKGCLLRPGHPGPCVADSRHGQAGKFGRDISRTLDHKHPSVLVEDLYPAMRGPWDGIPEAAMREVADDMLATVRRKMDEAILGTFTPPETGSPPCEQRAPGVRLRRRGP